jgi:hypothetical protein
MRNNLVTTMLTLTKNAIIITSTSLLFIFTCICACKAKWSAAKATNKLELTASLGGISSMFDSIQTIYIKTTLSNPTNDTLNFISMICSYEDMFLTNNSSFYIEPGNDCFLNGYAIINIPPKSKLDQFILVKPNNKNINIRTSEFKIGFHYVPFKKEDSLYKITAIYDRHKNESILWSDTIKCARLFRDAYK